MAGRCPRAGWWSIAGPCPGLQTIGRAELVAICHLLCSAPPGTIVTDCLSVFLKCISIQDGHITKEELLRSRKADLWGLCWPHLRSSEGWQLEWMPSDNTAEEAATAGVCEEDRLGNAEADAAAKATARAADISPQLLQQWLEQQAAISAVWRLIAESQVAHLANRARRSDGRRPRAVNARPPPGLDAPFAAGPRRQGPRWRLLRLQRRRRQHWRHHREHH